MRESERGRVDKKQSEKNLNWKKVAVGGERVGVLMWLRGFFSRLFLGRGANETSRDGLLCL